MRQIIVRRFAPDDTPSVIACWQACNLVTAWNDPESDISLKLAFQPDLFFIAEKNGEIIGTVMVGYEGHRGWINYLGVLPEYQKSGVGRLLMDQAESVLRSLGCPKINLMVRATNTAVIAFYERLGFTTETSICLGKRLT